MLTRLQLAAIHEAGHIIVADCCSYRVKSAWIHQITDGTGWGSGGFSECEMPLPDNNGVSREDLRKCSLVVMAGIASELIWQPSLCGSPYPWSGHQDALVDGVTSSGLPTDVTLLHTYIRCAHPPIDDGRIDHETLKAYRSARDILAPRRKRIGMIADALGAAYTNGKEKLNEDAIRRLLGKK